MEKLGQLAATGKWDLIVVDTPPSRSALDFLDAPQRMSTFLDGRMIRLLVRAGPGGRAGPAQGRRAPGSRCSPRRCRRSSAGRCSPTRRRSCRRSTRCSAASGNAPPPPTSCCARRAPRSSWSPRPSRTRCARRPTSSTGCAPRTCRWPGWCSTARTRCSRRCRRRRARDAADELRGAPLAAAVLRLHADRVDLAAREDRLLARFTGAHPAVAVTRVPVVAGDVADLDGLREIGGDWLGRGAARRRRWCAADEPEPARPSLSAAVIALTGVAAAISAARRPAIARRPSDCCVVRRGALARQQLRPRRDVGPAPQQRAALAARSSRPTPRTRCAGRARARGTRCAPGTSGRTSRASRWRAPFTNSPSASAVRHRAAARQFRLPAIRLPPSSSPPTPP